MTTLLSNRFFVTSLLVGALLAVPSTGQGLTDNSVAILPTAGIDSAIVYSLKGNDDKVDVVREENVRLVTDDLGPAAFTDFKLLPRAHRLLTDFNDRGVATTNESGEISFALAREGTKPGITSASVAGYDPQSQPTRIVFASNNEQRVSIYDVLADESVWERRLVNPSATAELVQSITLPEHRVAYAANWPALQLSGIDVIDLAADKTDPKTVVRFANKEHASAPDNLVVDPDIHDIHDLFALGPDRLLLTTADTLLVLSLEKGAVINRLALDDKSEFAGEFKAARKLPSGRIAVATVEPGLWTRPHPNHRVYWLDASLSTIIARTPSLSRAPWKVEPAKGHGGSGTFDFEPTSSHLPSGTSDDLELLQPIELLPEPSLLGETGTVRAAVSSSGRAPVFLASAAIVAKPGPCDSSAEWRNFVERTNTVVRIDEVLQLEGPFQVRDDAPTGEWCAAVRVQDRGGNRQFVGSKMSFEVVASRGDASTGTGRRVDPIDLGLRYESDANSADAGGGRPATDNPKQNGCGCSTPRSPLPTGALLLLLTTVALGVRRSTR